jgi:hypothetical protein
VSKKQRIACTSTLPTLSPFAGSAHASISAGEESAGDTGEDRTASATEEAPATLVASGGGGAKTAATLVPGGGGGAEAAKASVADPFPNILGGDSSPEGSRTLHCGARSPALEAEIPALSARRRVAEVSEDEADSPDAARLLASSSFPL